MGALAKIKHAWNALSDVPEESFTKGMTQSYAYSVARPDRFRPNISNERSIIGAIYNKIAVDVAGTDIRHVRLDENDRFLEIIKSGLNTCLSVEANIDQDARALLQDAVMTLFDKGVIAIVPIDTSLNPNLTGSYDIQTMRVAHIVKWYPRHVRVSVYDDREVGGGIRREVTLEKRLVAIIENPFYTVMNESSSTLQRLIRKLNLLDAVDEASSSGKLDLIIQLPYVIKSDARKAQAEQRRTDIEMQLKGSKYGIAYTDGTEKITQLNRPAENNLLGQITYLLEMLYGQLGLTPEIMNGTADEKAMLNYTNRTIKPIVDAIVGEMRRKFLTKTARSQGQSLFYFRDPFALVPIGNIAEIADKFARNEILTSNEIRAVIGFKPSTESKADKLQNSNMPAPSEPATSSPPKQEGDSQNGS